MKKVVILVFILVLGHVALAIEDNYNKYTSLQINTKISTTIDLTKKSSKGMIEYLQTDLELFPRITPEQQVIRQDIRGEPKASVQKGDTEIKLEWRDVEEDNISYTLDSDIRTYNQVRRIGRKIDFPIQNLDREIKIYTLPTEYIDTNGEIKEKAAEIAEGETDLYITTYKVGEWVRKNIKYDLNTLTATAVQKSSWVMTNKDGVCDEITNLFISMMRSLGVPARFVSGVVYSNVANGFENHGWAEVYLPEYGWVPFDVTFGEYGWIDPSHVKLDESRDSGEAAVTYNWRARNEDFFARPLKIETKIIKKEGQIEKLARLEAKPIDQDVGFGSYMILEVTAENLQDYYLPLTFAITKAPELMGKDPAVYTLLKPKEKKKFYWMLQIPENLDENYIYTTEIEAKSDFAETAKSQIRYGQGFKGYSKEWATETYDMLDEREHKILFASIDLNCSIDKDSYLSTENAEIKCVIRNLGNKNLDNVRVCAGEKCKETSLSIAQEEEIPFEIELKKSETLTITAETEKHIKEQSVQLNVKEIPEVKIISYEPETIKYNEQGNLVLKILSKTKAKGVEIMIDGVGDATLEELEGIYVVNVPIKGKQFRKGVINIKMKYKSEKGEEFSRKEMLGITVKELPWYARLLNKLGI